MSEAGAPLVGGALTFATGSGQAKAVSDASGHYQVSFAPTQSWGGHVDVDGYESTYRDSYFEAGPGVLNFRMFRLLRVTAGDAVRVTITNDGSVCGLEDEWLCRTVRVVAGRAGTLAVSVARNDSSSPAAVTIRENYYPPLVSVAVMAGEEVEVELLLPWSSSGGGVTLSTSIQ